MLRENLINIYEASFRENHTLPALTDYFKQESFTYLEMGAEIAKLHLLFDEAGIRQGDRIALIGRNNPRWCITYIATITYGAVIVPILQDFHANDVIHIINHSESRLLFLGDTFWDAIEADQIRKVEAVFSLTDLNAIYERRDPKKLTEFQKNRENHFRKAYPKGFGPEHIRFHKIPNDRMILLNYTSGTTGYSKGVMLSVNNLTGNVLFAKGAINTQTGTNYFQRGGRTLSFLPLAHAYGCAFDFLAPLAVGGHITLLGKIPTPKILIEAMQVVRPTIICCVPLILEKVYRKQVLPLLEKGPMSIAMKIPLLNTALRSVIRKKMMESFGGEVNIFIVGGAPMNMETEAFLMSIKFPITIGYGMTECAPLISYAPWNEFIPGSAGKILDIMKVRIDSDDPYNITGEIQVCGENVMKGYYKNEEATREVFTEDGWLKTGDLGTIDANGFIYIRGRSKTMILSSNGQNIFPEEIESKLNNMPFVLESLIIERNKKLVALVYPDYESLDSLGLNTPENLKTVMDENLKNLNKLVGNYEQVSKIQLYPTEFEKTPKKSIKRFLYNSITEE